MFNRIRPRVTVLTVALLAAPSLAFADDILVGCWLSNDVRRFGTDGTFKGVFVPAGTIGLTTPDGLALDRDGNVLVSSAEQGAVLRFTRDGAPMGVFASTNLGRAGFCAFGPDSRLYVCDSSANAVRRYDGVTGAYVDTFVSGGDLTSPTAITWWNGQMLVSSFGNRKVIRYDAATGGALGEIATGNNPMHSRVGPDGLLYLSEFGANRISKYDLTTGLSVGSFNFSMNGPIDHLLLPDGSMIVANWRGRRILHYTADGSGFGNPPVFAALTGAQPNDLMLLPDVPAPASGALFAMAGGFAARRRR